MASSSNQLDGVKLLLRPDVHNQLTTRRIVPKPKPWPPSPYAPPQSDLSFTFDYFFDYGIQKMEGRQFFEETISEVNATIRKGMGEEPLRYGRYNMKYLGQCLDIWDGSGAIHSKRLMDYDLLFEVIQGLDEYFSEEVGAYHFCYFQISTKRYSEQGEQVGKGIFRPQRRDMEGSGLSNETETERRDSVERSGMPPVIQSS